MQLIRKILGIMSVIVLILIVVYMDFSDLSWQTNKGNYLGITACLLNLWALIFLMKERKS